MLPSSFAYKGTSTTYTSACFDSDAQGREVLLHSLIVGMFGEPDTVPPGSVIDAGANTGEEACLLASVGDGRVVHAIEPLRTNIGHISRRYAAYDRLRPLLAGLSDKNGALTVPNRYNAQANATAGSSQLNWSYRSTRRDVKSHRNLAAGGSTKEATETVRLWTVDALFGSLWAGERLGFAHLDLEGMEIDALRGAAATLARDRPVLTVEVWTHTKDKATHDKLSHLASLNCDTYVIDEVAGVPFDVRNLLCVPREANLTTRPLPAKSWCRPIVSFRTCFRAVRYGAPAAATLALAAVSTWKPCVVLNPRQPGCLGTRSEDGGSQTYHAS